MTLIDAFNLLLSDLELISWQRGISFRGQLQHTTQDSRRNLKTFNYAFFWSNWRLNLAVIKLDFIFQCLNRPCQAPWIAISGDQLRHPTQDPRWLQKIVHQFILCKHVISKHCEFSTWIYPRPQRTTTPLDTGFQLISHDQLFVHLFCMHALSQRRCHSILDLHVFKADLHWPTLALSTVI